MVETTGLEPAFLSDRRQLRAATVPLRPLLTPPFVRTRARNGRRRSRREATPAAGPGGISSFAARRPPEKRGVHPAHPGRTWTGIAHRPIDSPSVVKDPALASTARCSWRRRRALETQPPCDLAPTLSRRLQAKNKNGL